MAANETPKKQIMGQLLGNPVASQSPGQTTLAFKRLQPEEYQVKQEAELEATKKLKLEREADAKMKQALALVSCLVASQLASTMSVLETRASFGIENQRK